MNWETAKTWLITIFFVLDLLLGWQWLQSRSVSLGYTESNTDLLANTKTLLAEHGLALATPIPEGTQALASLSGSFPNVRFKDLVNVAFPGLPITSTDPVSAQVDTSRGSVRIVEPGTWTVTYAPAIPVARGNLQSILSRVWKSAAYTADPQSDVPGETVLVQRYNGYPLFDVQVVLQTEKNAVTGYTQDVLVNVSPAGPSKPVISALDALDSLAVEVDKSDFSADNKISNISLGYLRKVTGSLLGNPAPTPTYWFPVWRIVTTSQVYYVNAFSGEVDT